MNEVLVRRHRLLGGGLFEERLYDAAGQLLEVRRYLLGNVSIRAEDRHALRASHGGANKALAATRLG